MPVRFDLILKKILQGKDPFNPVHAHIYPPLKVRKKAIKVQKKVKAEVKQ